MAAMKCFQEAKNIPVVILENALDEMVYIRFRFRLLFINKGLYPNLITPPSSSVLLHLSTLIRDKVAYGSQYTPKILLALNKY